MIKKRVAKSSSNQRGKEGANNTVLDESSVVINENDQRAISDLLSEKQAIVSVTSSSTKKSNTTTIDFLELYGSMHNEQILQENYKQQEDSTLKFQPREKRNTKQNATFSTSDLKKRKRNVQETPIIHEPTVTTVVVHVNDEDLTVDDVMTNQDQTEIPDDITIQAIKMKRKKIREGNNQENSTVSESEEYIPLEYMPDKPGLGFSNNSNYSIVMKNGDIVLHKNLDEGRLVRDDDFEDNIDEIINRDEEVFESWKESKIMFGKPNDDRNKGDQKESYGEIEMDDTESIEDEEKNKEITDFEMKQMRNAGLYLPENSSTIFTQNNLFKSSEEVEKEAMLKIEESRMLEESINRFDSKNDTKLIESFEIVEKQLLERMKELEISHSGCMKVVLDTNTDIEHCAKNLSQLNEDIDQYKEQYEYFQEMGRFTDNLSDLLDTKLPEIEIIESQILDIQERYYRQLFEKSFHGHASFITAYREDQYERAASFGGDGTVEITYDRFLQEVAILVEKMKTVFNDVDEDYYSLTLLKTRFEGWKSKYPSLYRDTYCSLCLQKMFSIFSRYELFTTGSPISFGEMKNIEGQLPSWSVSPLLCTSFSVFEFWKTLFNYGENNEIDEETILPEIIRKTIFPFIQHTLSKIYNPMDFTQTRNAIEIDGYHLEYRAKVKYLPKADILWKIFPSYSLLIVSLSNNSVLVFKISGYQLHSVQSGSSYEQEYIKQRTNNTSSFHEKLNISEYAELECEYGNIGGICASDKKTGIIIGTNTGGLLFTKTEFEKSKSKNFSQYIGSDFILQQLSSTSKKLVEQDDRLLSIKSLSYNTNNNIFAIVLELGAVLIIISEKTMDLQNLRTLRVIENLEAVCVQFNKANNLLAVGCKNSQVILFEIAKNNQLTERSRLSLAYRGFTYEELGSVASICFSPHDGLVVAVGFSKRGFAVFHISGICIMTTLPQFSEKEMQSILSQTNQTHVSKNKLIEPFGSGVRSLVWNSDGCHLVAVSNGTSTLADFTFCKSILSNNFAQSKNSKVVLQTSEKLLRFHMSSGTDFVNADWEPLEIPRSYLGFNYPIENVATSPDGNSLALSGRKGCIIYSGNVKKWRMFGNLEQEYCINCIGMVWIDNIVLAIVSRNDLGESELLLYPKHHLSDTTRLEKRIITNSNILFIDTTSVLLRITENQMKLVHLIFMYDESMTLHIYTCPIDYGNNNSISVSLTKLEVIDMSKFHSIPPKSMISVSCHSRCSINSSENTKLLSSTRLIFLHTNGDIGAFRLHGSRMELILERGVDGIWIDTEKSFGDNMVYFTFNGKMSRGGTDLSIVDLSQLPKLNHVKVKNIIPFDTEGVPIGMLKEFGVFLQISESVKQRICAPIEKKKSSTKISDLSPHRFSGREILFLENPLGFPHYEMQPKMYPYIHGLLLGFLIESSEEDHEKLVSFTKNLPAFQNSPMASFTANLEWMLHCALGSTDSSSYLSIEKLQEDHKFVKVDMRDSLQKVVNFLHHFSQFNGKLYYKLLITLLDIVVNCLRKTDIVHWDKIFKCLPQSPLAMFESFIHKKSVHSAANMLKILQHTEGIDQVLKFSYQVLTITLSQLEFELANDILRFINLIEEEKKAEDNTEMSEKEDNPIVESIISIQMRELMTSCDLFALLQLERSIKTVSLKKWLQDGEKLKSGKFPSTLIEDSPSWEEMFSKIHKSFNIPRANKSAVNNMLDTKQNEHLLNHEYFTTTQNLLYITTDLKNDLEHLLECFVEGETIGYALLIATLLCDVGVLSTILKENKDYRFNFLNMFKHKNK
ncbi:WD40 domain-containing protein [Naegleria gruberi]|uniref:WD40 domain-containing protein n=1 Tax=Naegleria gruberi TaxID=5762 RepID=D2UXV3_NAEGR|nr:WD40 domain-containing protein [Naegleria gruberi]EFC50694.1 WD40 domain-containing protein [Naegleria gruberi]|eukprot:XP_002683438.1 WD40 domain-containing protein [Naegleria gruberi strain NEG-M]